MSGENVFKRKWTKFIIGCFNYSDPGEIVSYSEIKRKIWKKVRNKDNLIDDRALSEILKELVNIGFLKKHDNKKRKGYSLTQDEHLSYIFKIQDESAIMNCPFSSIHSTLLPYQLHNGKEVSARYLTFYGEKNKEVYEIAFQTTRQLCEFYRRKHREIFEELLKKELCICNIKIKNCLNDWSKWMIKESGLLHPQREFEINPDSYGPKTFVKIAKNNKLTSNEIIKTREKIQKIMKKLETTYPPTTIVMRF